MARTQSAITVQTSVTLLYDANDGQGDGIGGASLIVHNSGPETIYVGNLSVTTSTGIPVATGERWSEETVRPGENLYAVTAANTATVRMQAVGVG